MQLKAIQEMNDLPVILFPQSFLHESRLRQILSFFGPLDVFQPWFMEEPAVISDTDLSNSVRIKYPPDNLRPSEGFNRLLSDYHLWMLDNKDNNYIGFLQTGQEKSSDEDNIWEIRQTLRRMAGNNVMSEDNCSLRWHLVLHLAREIEEQQIKADRILDNLREKNSPLAESVEGGDEIKNLFEDIPQMKSETVFNNNNIRNILDAWFTLFSVYLKGDEILVTHNRHIMDYITELGEEIRCEDGNIYDPIIRFKFPDLSHYDMEDLARIKSKYFKNDKVRELRCLLKDFPETPSDRYSSLLRLSEEVETCFPWELSGRALNIMLKYFPQSSYSNDLQANQVLNHIAGKVIIFMEDISDSE